MRQPSSLKWDLGPGPISQAKFFVWRSRREKEKGSVRIESFLPRLNMRIHPKVLLLRGWIKSVPLGGGPFYFISWQGLGGGEVG